MNDRIHPQDLLAERTLLASLIIDSRMVRTALECVTADVFYATANRKIFQAICRTFDEGEPVDIVTICSTLERKRSLDQVGGTGAVAELTELATVADIRPICRILNEKYARRQAIDAGQRMVEAAFSPEISLEQIESNAEQIYERVHHDCERAGAKRHRRGRVVTVAEKREAVHEYRYKMKDQAFGTGWKSVNRYFRLARGTMTVVTGIPHHGKSVWVDQLMVQMSELHDWRWAIYSPESLSERMGEESHIMRLVNIYSRKTILDELTTQQLDAGIDWVDSHFVFLAPDEFNVTVDSLHKLFLEARSQRIIDGMVWDPWNRISKTLDRQENEKEYLFRILGTVHGFAKRNSFAQILVAHPTKMEKDKSGKYCVPTLYDIYGSSAWYDMVDNGICIYRNYEEGAPSECHIQKVKWFHHGHYGMVEMPWNNLTHRFDDSSADDQQQISETKLQKKKPEAKQEALPL